MGRKGSEHRKANFLGILFPEAKKDKGLKHRSVLRRFFLRAEFGLTPDVEYYFKRAFHEFERKKKVVELTSESASYEKLRNFLNVRSTDRIRIGKGMAEAPTADLGDKAHRETKTIFAEAEVTVIEVANQKGEGALYFPFFKHDNEGLYNEIEESIFKKTIEKSV